MREIKRTPPRMIENGRVAEWGLFKEPFSDVNLLDCDIGIGSRSVPRVLRRFRLKEWQHIAVLGHQLMMGFALVDGHYMGNSFCWAANTATGSFVEHHRETPGGFARTSSSLLHGDCHFSFMSYRMQIENRLDEGVHRVAIDIAGRRGLPPIRARLTLREDLTRNQPLIVVLPVGENRPLYTHKAVCPLEGEVVVGDRVVQLDPTRDMAILDVQKTYYPFDTFWKWATFAGHDENGRVIAGNFCNNLISDDENYNENCLWIDGELTPLSAVRFEFNETAPLKPWRIRTTDGLVDLGFTAMGKRSGYINLGVMMSDYHQPFGEFTGKVTDLAGNTHEIRGMRGVTENHRARF